MTPEMLLAIVSGQSISAADVVGGRKPEWTLVAAGWATAGGLDECCHLAFRYRYGRDGSVYSKLKAYLTHAAQRLAWHDKWRRKVSGRAYLDQIIVWVLLEEWMSLVDRQRLLAHLMNTWPDGAYERELSEKQRRIAMILDRWCATAHEHIRYRIRDVEEDIDAVPSEFFDIA